MSDRPAKHNRENATDGENIIIDLLQEISEVLRSSTIVEERGKDATSKFWAAYKKVSSEYDDDMLERCNSNMDIVLIFAGLFSAVNTAFITAMQPNPVNTTNVLLAQLVQISLNGSSVTQPMIISPSTGYSSSDFWTQALAYTSLVFSLLAAFGAVLGKQWLGYYKTNRYVRGSLEERCKQRHRKFQGLEKWWFENVLGSFPDLLKFSLFLFGLSLGAAMWSQQQTISTLIITTTASGVLFYALTIVASVRYPDCPFQTRISSVIRTRFYPGVQPAELPTESAIGWLLSTSTNPDVIKSALELLPIISSKTNVNLELLSQKVRHMFEACFDQEGYVLLEDSGLICGKALVHLFQTYPKLREVINQGTYEWNPQVWNSWRDLYVPWALEQCRTSFILMENLENAAQKQQLQADTRSALRMAVSAGLDRFSHPDDMDLVYGGRFRWEFTREHQACLWACLEHFCGIDDDAAGDTLLLLCSMAGGDFPLTFEQRCRDVQAHIAPSLTSPCPRRLRHIVLTFAIRSLHQGWLSREEPFSHTVLEAIFPPVDHTIQNVPNTGNDSQFANAIALLKSTEWPEDSDLRGFPLPDIQLLVLFVLPVPKVDNLARYTPYCDVLAYYIQAHQPFTATRSMVGVLSGDFTLLLAFLPIFSPPNVVALSNAYYLRLASILAKVRHDKFEGSESDLFGKCICIMKYSSQHGIAAKIPPIFLFYLAGIVLSKRNFYQKTTASGTTDKHWWDLIQGAWHAVDEYDCLYDDPDDILAALAKDTLRYMPSDASRGDLEVLCKSLGNALDWLGSRQPLPEQGTISAVRGLKDKICRRLEATGQDE